LPFLTANELGQRKQKAKKWNWEKALFFFYVYKTQKVIMERQTT
jgi:hypothetical protein